MYANRTGAMACPSRDDFGQEIGPRRTLRRPVESLRSGHRAMLNTRVPVALPILGNQAIQHRLLAAADADHLHHAYLFEGPDGVGKSTFALWFARYVNCTGAARPCGKCGSCRQMLAGSHPDLIVVGTDPERVSRVVSVDQVHRVIQAVQLQRHSAKRRFVIIDPADAMNDESANAMLKTLEEPPAGTQFILITARVASLLSTIRSRSQRVRFGPLSDADMATFSAKHKLSDEIVRAAGGSPGRALLLAGGEGETRLKIRDAILAAAGQPLHRLMAFAEAEGKKEEGESRADVAVDLLEELLRDATMLAAGRADRMNHPDATPALKNWAQRLEGGGLERLGPRIADARLRLKLNVNGRIVLEALIAQLNLELR